MRLYSNIIVVVLYIIVMGYLAYRGRRGGGKASGSMIAKRGVLSLAYGGNVIGAAAIIGFGGAAALFGFSLLWLCLLSILLGIFIAFVFFGARTRRMGIALHAQSFPEMLGERYQSRFIQGFAGMVVFAFIPLFGAAILIGVARLIEVSFHVPYLTGLLAFSLFVVIFIVIGGLTEVWYVDTAHGLVVFAMLAILCFWTYHLLGGIVPAHQALTAIAPLVPERLAEAGHEGWTAGLRWGSPLWWIAWSSLIYGVGIGTLVQPPLVARFLTASSERELDRAVLVGGVFMLVVMGVSLTVGPLTNILFAQRLGEISIAVAGGNTDKIIPLYVDRVMPWWFGPLFLVGVLSASLAALRLLFRVGGASLGKDFYGKAMGFDRGGEGFPTTVGITFTIVATVLWGLVLPPGVIARATAFFFGLCAAAFLSLYCLGLYWKGVTRAGGIASMVGGIGMSFLWMIFFHGQESAILGICQVLFGTASLVADFPPTSWAWRLQYVDPVVVALPVSFALCVVVSRKTRKLPKKHLARCFKDIKR